MNQIVTKGIVLARVNFGEADRIVTMLTPDHGKLRLMAKGVRRVKSKLAGGIELFSVSDITFIKGRGEIDTLISTRLNKHFASIVKDINRTMLGYELIKQLNKATEESPEPDYFELLRQAFSSLNKAVIDIEVIKLWFAAQLLRLGGHTPNLQTNSNGEKLKSDGKYEFDFDNSAFINHPNGKFTADDIKFLRLLFSGNQPAVLVKIVGYAKRADVTKPIVQYMQQRYIH